MCGAVPDPSAPPVVLAPNPAGIPAELRGRPQWVTHRDKAPCCALADKTDADGRSLYGKKIDYTDDTNLAGFDQACRAAHDNEHDGVGFSTLPADPYILIDIDHCVRPDGSIAPLVLFWVQRLATYAEYSTGDGVHMIGRGCLPGEGNRFRMTDPTTGETFKVEVYDHDRYFRITGRTPEGLPTEIIENQDGIEAFCGFLVEQRGTARRTTGQPSAPDGVTSPAMTDDEVIRRPRNDPAYVPGRFDKLFDQGDLSGQGGDHSASDFALCCRLAYWTQDVAQLDRLFRRSALMRDKWDEVHYSDGATYGARTIANALAEVTKHYSPPDGQQTEPEEGETRPGAGVYRTIDPATGECQVHRGGIVCRRGGRGELRTRKGAQWPS